VALAEKLAQITPGKLQKSFFTNSGTEANEAAVLVARMGTGSFDVVALRHGYSGHSQLTKSLTAMAPWRKSGVISVGVAHAISPSANGMANGVAMGLTIAAPEVADAFKGMTISTFGGNPVTAVAARATIEVIEEEKLLENADSVGGYFRQKLDELKEKHTLIGDVRGMGLMQGLELVRDRKTKEPAPEATNQFMERCRSNGLLI